MAVPAFHAVGTRLASASAATLSPALPAGLAGYRGLLLCVVTSKNNAAHSCATAGWTLIGQTNAGAAFTSSLWAALDTAAAPTFNWVGAAACSAQIAHYFDADGPLALTSVAIKSVNTGTTSPHSSASFNSAAANSLAVYLDTCGATTGLATPAGWTEDNDQASATDAGDTTWGHKNLGASGSASGAISVVGGAAAWVQRQLEIKQSVASTGLDVSEAEAGAWIDTPPGLVASEVEAGVWLDQSIPGLSVDAMEVGVWLDGTVVPPPSAARIRAAQIIA
jgi:hypothetical protein